MTSEICDVLSSQLSNQTRGVYEFEKSLQAPVMEMKLRGVLVDQAQRAETLKRYVVEEEQLRGSLNEILSEGLGIKGFSPTSYQQLHYLFYQVMGLPPVKKRNSKGEWAPTVDRDALEQLDHYFGARPLVSHILKIRDCTKKIGVLKTGIDKDGRIRTSYNIAGTRTGRFSSNLSDFGTGTNMQNIEDSLRRVFVADPGYKFAYIDLEQAESRAVGAIEWNLFKDGRYLDACESGDLHTSVCRLAWGGQLPWTGDIRLDRELAEAPFYRQHSYRHMAKVLGHGTNYNGKPITMSKHTKLDTKLISDFQLRYFQAFPSHQRWHAWVASEIARTGSLVSLTGRPRWFFGRRDDDAVIREAIAYDPQGSVGDILNMGMLNVWRTGTCHLLLQVHDAILVQFPEKREDEILPKLLKYIEVPIELRHGRKLLIPSEAKTGWNWGGYGDDNSDGLKKWSGADDRKRQRLPATSELDRVLYSI